jgi:Siphovirus Gp157.
MKLYELSEQYRQIQQMIDDGEVSQDDVIDTLDGIDGEFEIKADNIIKITKEIDQSIDFLGGEIKRLQARKKSLEAGKQRMRDYLRDNMASSGKQRIKSDMFTISLGKPKESIVIDNDLLVPCEYITETCVTHKFDKKALLAAAKENPVEGVHVEVGKPVLTVR